MARDVDRPPFGGGIPGLEASTMRKRHNLAEQPGFDEAVLARQAAQDHQAFLAALKKSAPKADLRLVAPPQQPFGTRMHRRGAGAMASAWHTAAGACGSGLKWATGRAGPVLRTLARALQGAFGGLPWRRIGQGTALATASGLAMASALVSYGYATYNPDWVRAQLARREGQLLLDHQGAVLGALYAPRVDERGRPVDHVGLGFTRPTQPPPENFIRMLLQAEHHHHFTPWRNLCGVDAPAKLAAAFGAAGRGGASTLAEQIGKFLVEPDAELSDHWLVARLQKIMRLGVACSVNQALGGAQGVLDTYVAIAPYSQIGGSTRNAEAAAQVLFGKPLNKLSNGQFAELAAAVQRPIAQVDTAAFKPGCDALRAMGAAAAKAQGRDTQVARGQCRTLARARAIAQGVLLPGPELDAALAEIAADERTGIQPQDAFAPLPTKRLANLSVRAQTLMGPTLVQVVADMVDEQDLPSAALTLSFDGHQQQAFSQDLRSALKAVDTSSAARAQLCVTLLATSGPRHCRNTPASFGQAQVLLARARIGDGGLSRVHLPTTGALDQPRQMGSLAKLVITVAALRKGYAADSPVCPRAAQDNGRRLRRDTRVDPYGYADCTGRSISFATAFATSDSLAFYEVARHLGNDALLEVAEHLGLDTNGEWRRHAAFDLSFGTVLATPAEILALGQAVFGVAYSQNVHATAPRLLMSADDASAETPLAFDWLAGTLPSAAQRQQLRRLLEAPLTDPRGTLTGLKGTSAVAGKSGTTSSPRRPAPGLRPYVQAKLSLTYHPVDQTVALTVISGPEPLPLSVASMPVAVLDPVRIALLR